MATDDEREYKKQYYLKNKEKIRAQQKEWRLANPDKSKRKRTKKPLTDEQKVQKSINYKKYSETIEGRVNQLFNSAKTRAGLKNVPFELTKEWYTEKLTKGTCEVTGIPFVLEKSDQPSVNHFAPFYSPSVDRIIPELGYTVANCRMVLQGYNQCKGTSTDDDVLKLALAIVKAYYD